MDQTIVGMVKFSSPDVFVSKVQGFEEGMF